MGISTQKGPATKVCDWSFGGLPCGSERRDWRDEHSTQADSHERDARHQLLERFVDVGLGPLIETETEDDSTGHDTEDDHTKNLRRINLYVAHDILL